jgi:acyl-CoA synthetase (AMP-forming)/AMP-acid ligase II
MFDAYVAFWARVKPHELALSMLGPGITYAQFNRDIDRFAVGLEALGLPSRGGVGVRLPSPYAHWLTVMALVRLRVASASIPLCDAVACDVVAAVRPSLLVTDIDATHATRVVILSPDWITAILRGERALVAERSFDADGIGRISTSSGTNGAPKAMAVSWRMIIKRSQRRALLDRSLGDTALALAGNDIEVIDPAGTPCARGLKAK